MSEVLEVWLESESGLTALAGHLARDSGRTGEVISFEYAQTWLDGSETNEAFALDPQLFLAGGRHYSRRGADRLSGAFEDVSPDRWGKLLMDRRELIEANEENRSVRNLRDWDYLIGVNDESRLGALRLRNEQRGYLDSRVLSAPPITDLRQLEAAAMAVEQVKTIDDEQGLKWLKQLIAPGASLGGARPKASFRNVDGSLWLAKFPSAEDRYDVGLWELLTCQLAKDVGIAVPPAKVLRLSDRGHTYAVSRFDRQGATRRIFASAMTLLDVDSSEGSSYLDLVAVIESVGTSNQIGMDLEQLFRRVMFNILIGNRDDHLRNHAFLREVNGWRLSPAFDVNPNPDRNSHVLSIDDSSSMPDTERVLATASYYRLSDQSASAIATQIRDVVRTWASRAKALQLKKTEIDLMRGVINPDR